MQGDQIIVKIRRNVCWITLGITELRLIWRVQLLRYRSAARKDVHNVFKIFVENVKIYKVILVFSFKMEITGCDIFSDDERERDLIWSITKIERSI